MSEKVQKLAEIGVRVLLCLRTPKRREPFPRNCTLTPISGPLLEGGSFHGLDQWKQSGFYSQPRGNSFVTPAEAVERQVAEAVYGLAWRASSTLDFLLKEGNLERYITSARVLRSKLAEEDHRSIEAHAEHVFAELFANDGDSQNETSH